MGVPDTLRTLSWHFEASHVLTPRLKSIANTGRAVPGSLGSPRSPLPAPAARGSDAVCGREGRGVGTQRYRAGPVTDDCRLNQLIGADCHQRRRGKRDVGDYEAFQAFRFFFCSGTSR